ncbi:methyltransferase (TIGR00027 family) [Lentzea atacamensis]|uniref:S-adenosyl-L-methionine-dependent methyltransferase n=1 Tax=Lentzea atacamensis TaxID=531938 RepID=A0A316HWG1_9PSEU|nr:SAM-dependent methyltransferase [Lentzea atacamensis]PWK84463.1 methyltransferase (TIGR00027 family) [Lentzea atacamensis]
MPDLKIPEDGLSQTALYTAWVRCEEAGRPQPLFTDPLAGFLVAELEDRPALAASVAQMRAISSGFPSYHVVRTRFFDDRIGHALEGGVRQVVVLGAGVDGRTTRLPCPPGTRWFELDLPDMTEFKTTLVARSGLTPTCERIGVAADLRTDWATPLRAAGFDPEQPSAWLAEGLLMHLTPEKGDVLLTALTALSAPGSHLFLDHLQASMLGEQGAQLRDGLDKHGVIFRAARDDIEDWLGAAGWRASVYAGVDPVIGHGRSVAPVPASWLAAATRVASTPGHPGRQSRGNRPAPRAQS